MNKMNELIIGLLGTAVSSIGLTISAETLDHIISIVCAVSGLIITLIVTLLVPLVKWWKKAKKDGKIDEEELDELSDILKDGKKSLDLKNQDKNKKGE